MIRPDILTVWPCSFDYPEWRYQVMRDRDLFNKVIVIFTHNANLYDFRSFLVQNHPDFTFVDTEPYKNTTDKWYDVAVNLGLKASSSPHVIFTEQDFWCRDGFMSSFLNKIGDLDFACLEENERLHFGCFLVKRHLVEQTMKYFYTLTTKGHRFDCFDLFTTELQALTQNFKTLQELGFKDGVDYHHMSGLTQNTYMTITGHEDQVNHKDEFKAYAQRCLDYKIPQIPEWTEVLKKICRLP